MQILSAADMRACDEATVRMTGLSWQELMENAGSAVARFAALEFPHAEPILVLCGKGNNGGDGLVAARVLESMGRRVEVILLSLPEHLEGGPRAAYDKLPAPVRRSLSIVVTAEELEAHKIAARMERAGLILDSVFGTGFRPPLRGVPAALQQMLSSIDTPVLAIDLPSGWDADSREQHNEQAYPANAVITFTAPKVAHIFGQLTRGPVVVASIGSPESVVQSSLQMHWAGGAKRIVETPRPLDSNKGRFGHVLVAGGSVGKAGAPAMAALGAMRAGAGLVTTSVPRSLLAIAGGLAPEMMTLPLEETPEGAIALGNAEPSRLEAMLRGMTVLAVGPGIGRSSDAAEFARRIVAQTTLPLVLDADGLNAFDEQPDLLNGTGRTLVITPHPGEMARLVGTGIPEVQQDRVAIARAFAQSHECITVLKGWRTVIAHPDGSVAVNTSGNPALAKGGSGDVLTGIIAGMLAQFPQQAREAVEAAVWLHGAAADLFVRERDERTMLATELLHHLSGAIRSPVLRDGFTWLQESLP